MIENCSLSIFRCLIFILLFFSSSLTSAEIITLQNGDTLHAVVKKKTDTQLHLEHEYLGTVAILREHITSINNDGEILSVEEKAVIPPDDNGLFGLGFFRNWKRSLEVSLNGAAGVSENSKFRSLFKMSYEDDKDRWDYSMFYLLTEENKSTSENRFTANLIKDWLISDSKWFYFSKLGYDWDRFKDWDYRIRSV